MTPGLIAIIDSQPVVRLGLETALRDIGFPVRSFGPSRSAVTVLLRGQLTGRPPEILIVDRQALRLVDSLAAECPSGYPPPRLILFGDGDSDLPVVSDRVERDADTKVVLATILTEETERSVIRLTRRESEVLALAAEGLPSAAIGGRLFISSGTVKLHLHHIYRKLGVRNRASAVYAALHAGLIAVPDQSVSLTPPSH